MIDYTDSLIKNFASHTSKLPSVNLSGKLNLLGDTLHYAHQSISAISSALITTKTTTSINTVHHSIPQQTTLSKIQGQLNLTIVEARNLNLTDNTRTEIYCIVHYGGSTISTLNQATRIPVDILGKDRLNDSPKWQYSQSLDVPTKHEEMIVQVYDRDDLLLGRAKWTPTIGQEALDIWLPLESLKLKEQATPAGEIRLQVRYTQFGITTKLTPSSFRILRQIGQGSFGKVYKVEKKDTKVIYAMKVLPKRLLMKQNEVDHTISERNVLIQTTTSPFIVNLQYSFQTADHLFLVMDYLPGGDLYTYLQRRRLLEEDQARFFMAELVCALSDLHAHKVVYRDLKPENILLDDRGHIALTDFGLCKELKENDTTSTFCGTTEYMPPEMILKEDYTQAIDSWCLGILLYELVTGGAPFHSVHLETLYQRILKQPLTFPSSITISHDCKDLIQQLLQRDPMKRLDPCTIKQHPFFKNINWDLVAKKQMMPPEDMPILDTTASPIDICHNPHPLPLHHPITSETHPAYKQLDSSSLGSQCSFMLKHSPPLTDSTQSQFQGFSYTQNEDPSHLLTKND